MNAAPSRREFLKRSGQLGFACACGCGFPTRLSAEDVLAAESAPATKLPPLRSRAYCGLICTDRCPLRKATATNDTAAKKVVFEKWRWREKYGVEFEADKVFCHGCKPDGKPRAISVSACTVRACTTDRGLESCLQCHRLASCDKELWKNSPSFRQCMEKLQQDYVAAGDFTLV
jgi:hypothetical protein